ncbi:DMT family transporter [candidate division WOR-3 bacterium]|nr:DMT family transporter [candidate division WOR-3 bacterium]
MQLSITNRKTLGVLSILGASIMWAIEPIFAKLSYQTTDFLNTFATRTIFCLAIISIYVFFTNKKKFIVNREYLPKLIYVSLVATLFADLMYIYALTKVSVINAVLIGHMQPIFIILIGFFVLKQDKITKFDYYGILFMILAGLLVTTKTLENLLMLKFGTIGDLYVLFATIAWATTAIVARKYLKELHAGLIAFYRFLFAGIIFIIYMIAFKGIEITSIYQVLIGIVIGIGTILYYEGIRLIKAAQVSALELSTPFFAAILGYLILGEYITLVQFIGILFLIKGIYFLSKKENL